jgi:hypothetical protein
LLPSFFVEAIPGIELLPTWTGCVAWVVYRQKKAPTTVPPPAIEIEATPVRQVPESSRKGEPPVIEG